jgi:CheY-like chemotaxis protein
MDVRQVITDTARLLENNAELCDGHTIEVDVPDEEVRYEADEGQIRQIVWNLATNGLRAMPDGRAAAARGRPAAPDGPQAGELEIAVQDEGVGIGSEDLDEIFQPFRGGFSKGTGLGLSIVHRIVSDYGGEVRVTSKPGEGTTVRVVLPLAGEQAAPLPRSPPRRRAGRRDVTEDHETDISEAPPAAAPAARILIVDDERSMREMLEILLRREGYDVTAAENGTAAIALLQERPFDMLISDVRMPDVSGIEVLRTAKALNPGDHRHHGDGLRVEGVHPGSPAAPGRRLPRQAVQRRGAEVPRPQGARAQPDPAGERAPQARARNSHRFADIVGGSPAMAAVFQLVETIAPTTSTVLISGESGTGKELIARAIHFNSPRKDRPFVAVNCGALSETLLDSELFGHVRGAFTGADSNKKGLIEVAEKGTIFLDEIGEMSPLVQVKLLRVLQERKFRRLGGTEEIEADIRILAATNRDLSKLVAEGTFREDLFYRINVIPMRLPPLRERPTTCRCSRRTSSRSTPRRWGRTSRGFRPARWRCCRPTRGPATSASWRTPSSAPWRSSGCPPSSPAACPRRCWAVPRWPPPRWPPATASRRRGSTSSSTSSTSSASTSPRPCAAPAA